MGILGAGPYPFLLDGDPILDGRPQTMLMDSFEESADPNFTEHQMLDGTIALTHHSTVVAGRVGPNGLARHTWATPGLLDETAYETFKRIARATFTHNLAIKIKEYERFATDATRTELYAWRQILGNGYAAALERGVNAVALSPYFSHVSIKNRLTGTTYTVANGGIIRSRNFTIISNALLIAGNNFVVTLTLEDGTVTAYTFTAGTHFAIGATATITGSNLATAINAAIASVTASATLGVPTVSRAVTTNVATIVTSIPHGLAVAQDVRVDGMGDAAYDGDYVVASTPSTTSFTYALVHANEATTTDTGGTVRAPGTSIVRDETDINVMSLSTTAAGGAATVHPNSSEIAIDISGAYPFRGIKLGVAPAAGPSVITLEAHFLYNVSVHLQNVSFAAGTTADGYLPFQALFRELGG